MKPIQHLLAHKHCDHRHKLDEMTLFILDNDDQHATLWSLPKWLGMIIVSDLLQSNAGRGCEPSLGKWPPGRD